MIQNIFKMLLAVIVPTIVTAEWTEKNYIYPPSMLSMLSSGKCLFYRTSAGNLCINEFEMKADEKL